MERLTGEQLLLKLAVIGDVKKSEKCDATGYYTVRPDGKKRYCYTKLYQAIAEAKGVAIEPAKRGKRKLAWKASVLRTGALLIGTRYVQELGLAPGDQVLLVKTKNNLQIEPAPKTPDVAF